MVKKERHQSVIQTVITNQSPKSTTTNKIGYQQDYFAQQLFTDHATDEYNSVTPSKILFSKTVVGNKQFEFPSNGEQIDKSVQVSRHIQLLPKNN